MYYVIQVESRKEEEMKHLLEVNIDSSTYKEIFYPRRLKHLKKGKMWNDVLEIMFPGYLFVETDTPKELAREIRKIYSFSRLVGFGEKENLNYMPLSKDEEKYLNHLMGKKNKEHIVDESIIGIKEGKLVKVIEGPLYGLEGNIYRIDLHKRIVIVNIDILGNTQKVHLPISYIDVEE